MPKSHPKNWQKMKLEEVVEIIDGDRGANYPNNEDFRRKGFCLFLSTKNVPNDKFDFSECYFISKEKDALLRSGRVRRNDIVLTTRGTVGNFALFSNKVPYDNIRINSGMVIFRPKEAIDPEYLKHTIKNYIFNGQLIKLSSGTAQPQLPIKDMKYLEIDLPPVEIQRRIASILSAFDDKIELNNKINQALEQMAQAIFKEWFVDFRFPGHEKVKIKNGLPIGWDKKALKDVCEYVVDGDWIETKDQGGADYRLLQVSNIGIGRFVETGNYRFITENTFKRLKCTELVPGHILVSRMPEPIGRAWLVTKMPWKMVTAVDVAIIKTDATKILPFICIYQINSPGKLTWSSQQASGTTRLRITRRALNDMELIMPPLDLQKRYNNFVDKINQIIVNNNEENIALTAARDSLLPKLMNGEVEI